jgi:hypothetical protein
MPHEATRWDVVMWIARAIRQKKEIQIEYTSLNPRSKKAKRVAPHALGHGSNRWHMRAWSREHNEFRDYTFDRIAAIEDVGPSPIDPLWDRAWHEEFPLLITPNPALPPEVQKVIAKERKMKHGQLTYPMPLALCFYLISELSLDLADKVTWGDGTGTSVSPHRLQLILKNWDEYNEALGRAKAESKQLLQQIPIT